MKVVKFLKHWHIYNVGEIAGLDATLADRLEGAGIVELFQREPLPEETPKEITAEPTLGEPLKGLPGAPKDKMIKRPKRRKKS